MMHTMERFIIHFFSSCGVMLCFLFAIRFLARKVKSPFIPATIHIQLLVCALAIFGFSTLREAWDMHNGQTLAKAISDYVSWLLGCGLSAWGLYRFGGKA